MGKQIELLELQSADSALDRLTAERAQIPEEAQVKEVAGELEKVSGLLAQLESVVHESERTQDRLESDESTLSSKIEREEKKLYGGGVANPKELGAIQEEVATLKRKRDELETLLLEAMETVEEQRGQVQEVEERKVEIEGRLSELRSVLGRRETDLDAKIAKAEQARDAASKAVSPDLLATYEKVRAQKGGVAVGRLAEGICGACRVELPAEELDKMKGADSLWRCPQCRRILVECG